MNYQQFLLTGVLALFLLHSRKLFRQERDNIKKYGSLVNYVNNLQEDDGEITNNEVRHVANCAPDGWHGWMANISIVPSACPFRAAAFS